ncbi:hypothetical protein ACWIUH_09290 [Ursidibacter arcticus]
MKRHILNLSVIFGVATLLSGCVMQQPFHPKVLNENAKGIATVKSTPYGCKVLGEAEGKDGDRPDMQPPRLSQAREGALNEVRNNAVEIVGSSAKRITLRVIEEKATCFTGDGSCPNLNDNQYIKDYYITAQIFECGDKK